MFGREMGHLWTLPSWYAMQHAWTFRRHGNNFQADRDFPFHAPKADAFPRAT